MKPFLGIDITQDKNNINQNGNEFFIAEPSSAMKNALDQSQEKVTEILKQSKLPKSLRLAQLFCGSTGLFIFLAIIRVILEKSISLFSIYEKTPWLFWIAGGLLLAWLFLIIIGKQKENRVLGNEENLHTLSNLKTIQDTIFSELGVLSSAQNVDILSITYKIKDGLPFPKERPGYILSFFNFEYKIFADSQNLFLINLNGKYSFPLSSLSCIRMVKKRIFFPFWNKEIPYNKGSYKKYKLSRNNYGHIIAKQYYILELSHNGETWGIYFPNYELPIIEAITGLQPTE